MFACPAKMSLSHRQKKTVSTGSTDGNLFHYKLLLYCVEGLREQIRKRRTENQALFFFQPCSVR